MTERPPPEKRAPADFRRADAFRRVDTWIFDLDNTLYPPHSDLWPRIDARITAYMIALFGLDGQSARALQKHYYRVYGTTLAGLIREYDVAPDEFLHFVHDIDRSALEPDPALANAIDALPGRKLILTNGSHGHALATAKQLGIDHLFEGMFAIEHGDYLPKPHLETYQKFFARHAVEPSRAAMFEDIAHNLAVPHAAGMLTVLVRPKQGAEDHREAWEKHDEAPPHVDFTTDDLIGFLEGLVRR